MISDGKDCDFFERVTSPTCDYLEGISIPREQDRKQD